MYIISLSYIKNKPAALDEIFDAKELLYPRYFTSGVIDTIKHFSIFEIKIEGVRDNYITNEIGTLDPNSIVENIKESGFPSGSVHETFCKVNSYFGLSWEPKILNQDND